MADVQAGKPYYKVLFNGSMYALATAAAGLRGYPYGLRAEQIGPGPRILAVCDTYDTMTSERPYRAAMPREAAMASSTAKPAANSTSR